MYIEDIFFDEFPYRIAFGLLLYKTIYNIIYYLLKKIRNKREGYKEKIKQNLINELIRLDKEKKIKLKEKLLINWGEKLNLNFEALIEDSKYVNPKEHEKFLDNYIKTAILPELKESLNKTNK